MATTFAYLGGLQIMLNGNIDWDSSTIKAMLVGSGYTPDCTDTFIGSGSGTPGGEEIVVDGYTGGFGGSSRVVVTGRTVTRNNSQKAVVLDCDDVSFGVLGGGTTEVPVDAMIIIRENTDDSNSRLVLYVKFSQTYTDGTEFKVKIDPDGIVWLVVSET